MKVKIELTVDVRVTSGLLFSDHYRGEDRIEGFVINCGTSLETLKISHNLSGAGNHQGAALLSTLSKLMALGFYVEASSNRKDFGPFLSQSNLFEDRVILSHVGEWSAALRLYLQSEVATTMRVRYGSGYELADSFRNILTQGQIDSVSEYLRNHASMQTQVKPMVGGIATVRLIQFGSSPKAMSEIGISLQPAFSVRGGSHHGEDLESDEFLTEQDSYQDPDDHAPVSEGEEEYGPDNDTPTVEAFSGTTFGNDDGVVTLFSFSI